MAKRIRRKQLVMEIEGIKRVIPQRYPFLMIDRIIAREHGKCTAVKNVTSNEPFFAGHFPDQAVMPGNLIAEAMAQAASFVGGPEDEDAKLEPTKGLLVSMHIDLQAPVIPGDVLVLDVSVVKRIGKVTKFTGEALVENQVVAHAEFATATV